LKVFLVLMKLLSLSQFYAPKFEKHYLLNFCKFLQYFVSNLLRFPALSYWADDVILTCHDPHVHRTRNGRKNAQRFSKPVAASSTHWARPSTPSFRFDFSWTERWPRLTSASRTTKRWRTSSFLRWDEQVDAVAYRGMAPEARNKFNAPMSNWGLLGVKCTVSKKVLATLMGLFGVHILIRHPGHCAPLPSSLRPRLHAQVLGASCLGTRGIIVGSFMVNYMNFVRKTSFFDVVKTL